MRCADVLYVAWVRATTFSGSERYPIERLCELCEYRQHTPLWRVLGVLVLSVLPAFAMIVLLDSIPLQDPFGGWDKNSGLWVRMFVGTLVVSLGGMFQARSMTPAAELTLKQCVAMSVWLAIVQQATAMLVAALWVFPTPFAILFANPPWALAIYYGIRWLVGREKFAAQPEIKTQLWRFMNYGNVSGIFLVVFPVYSKIFQSLHGLAQTPLILALPATKFVLKRITRWVVAGAEDLVPVLLVTVDLFSALFQAKCMQIAGSHVTIAAIILIDVVQNAFSLARLFRLVEEVKKNLPSSNSATDLLDHCESLLKAPEGLKLCDLRLRSWTKANLSAERAAIVAKLDGLQRESARLASSRSPKAASSRRNLRGPRGAAVVPWSPTRAMITSQRTQSATSFFKSTAVVPAANSRAPGVTPTASPCDGRYKVLKQSLALLWRCECILLVEYVEAVVPLVFSTSTMILYHLPNAKYYPGMVELSDKSLHTAIVGILLYSALEFTSLLYLHAVLEWRFRVSALHQLAFVLEKQWLSVQGLMLAWVILVLSFTLVHNGTSPLAWSVS